MPNHLIEEKSPYLLQHVNNPVDWFPWGPAAFDKARREDKPIFLSIGYSTCHWCHVMERESFENLEIAEVLNAHFVAVKVDREERPDVDRIYMAFVQATTQSGGWPMSVFLTPDRKPFFGGTYFPPDNRYGRPGFRTVLESLARAWKNERAKLEQSSADVIAQLQQISAPRGGAVPLDLNLLDPAFQYFRRSFDQKYGGFGGAPKFPRPVVFNFLFRYFARTGNEDARDMSLKTLRAMAEGGMNDQLGGGFHRYSVDETWFLPHFEKMLYDQAQLVVSFLEAYRITQDPYFAGIARRTLDYVLRDMTDAQGGFYSAEDADSVVDRAHPHEKAEGAFYVWTRPELDRILGHPEAAIFAFRYGVETGGNVHNDPHGEFPEKNILFPHHSLEETGRRFSMGPAQVDTILTRAAGLLLEHRATRVRPHRDDKILTAWNGLMISAFAQAAQVLDDARYALAARRAADFLLSRMYDRGTRTLKRRYRDQDAAIPGFLDDYAFLAQALLDLYETDFQAADLDAAMELTQTMIDLFEDPLHGDFFGSAAGDDSLVMRLKDDYDGAEPAGNSVALCNLLRLAHITGREDYARKADRTLEALSARIAQQGVAVPQMLVALEMALSPKRQVVLVGDPSSQDTLEFLRAARTPFSPLSVTLLIGSEEARRRLLTMHPELAEMRRVDGKTTAYVCENFTCQLPTTDLAKFRELLTGTWPN